MPPMIEDTLDQWIPRVPSGLETSISSVSSDAHMLLPIRSVEPMEVEEAKSVSSPLGPGKGPKRKGMKVTFKVQTCSSFLGIFQALRF